MTGVETECSIFNSDPSICDLRRSTFDIGLVEIHEKYPVDRRHRRFRRENKQ